MASVSSTTACLTDKTIVAFVEGRLDAPARAAVEAHVKECWACGSVLAELARFHFDAAAPHPTQEPGEGMILPPGSAVSRYVIQRPVGRGGFGVVYEAFDPQLKRRVALKLLRPGAFGSLGAEESRARLLREAEALARLSHRNVVAVHDAGTVDGDQVFIVMEMIEGQTLTRWLEGERGEREILDVFRAAGRGLAAAHAAGLVHRDFKPDNVVVGTDGRIVVTDFGLARPVAMAVPADASALPATPTGEAPALVRTALVGTPGFMSPEQSAGRPADARSDQWSFCLSLYRALYRSDPPGEDASSSVAGTGVGIRAAVLRGLRFDPGDRHPSMDALLAELSPGPQPVRPRRGALVVGAAAVAVAAVFASVVVHRRASSPAARCGNGRLDPGEDCDDGNDNDGDGCTRACLKCAGPDSFFWPPSGHCYTLHRQPATWPDAQRACHADGGYLMTCADQPECGAMMTGISLSRATETWLGFRRDSEHPFRWVTGEPWTPLQEYWWSKTTPKPLTGDCAYQLSGVPDGMMKVQFRWPTAACDQTRPFVCEREPWTSFPHNGHRYRVFHDAVTWSEARQHCQTAGGHLATINDGDELNLAADMAKVELWLGGWSPPGRKPFEWVTGEPFDVKGFGAGEPDDEIYLAGGGSCLLQGLTRSWHDRRCEPTLQGARYPFLCEIE